MEASSLSVMTTTSLLLLLVAGAGACKDVPATSVAAACSQPASTSKHLDELCAGMLQGSPDNGDVHGYALADAGAVNQSYAATSAEMYKTLLQLTSSSRVKDALYSCINSYSYATLRIDDCRVIMGPGSDCALEKLQREFADAVQSVDDCATKILPVRGDLPSAYDMAIADRDRTFLAFRLALMVANTQ